MSTQRLANSSGSLAEVRAWLYHNVGLSELFQGRGYTALEDGTQSFKEYIVPNRNVQAFKAFKWVMLKIDREELKD